VHDVVIAAREVALGTLDLDDARAGIGQPAGALRRSHRLFDGDNEQAFEREGHIILRRDIYSVIAGLVPAIPIH
jgi:hypothetical protein